MVQLILASPKGNQGVRYFPYTGYLGMTPVKVEGVVRTKIESDLKQLPATSITITVRCYESRIGRTGVLSSNVLVDMPQVLWSKPQGQNYQDIGDMELPFRIVIPAKVAGFSTTSFVDYRCVWRVEAVMQHIHITGVGSRQIKHFELPLIRYDLPPHTPTTPTPSAPILNLQTNKPRAPRIRYCLKPPTSPIGPLDLISIPLHLFPVDPSVSIRSANVVIERRIQFYEPFSPASPTSQEFPMSNSSSLPVPIPSYSLPSSSTSTSYSPTALYHDSSNALLTTNNAATLYPTDSPISPSTPSLISDTDSTHALNAKVPPSPTPPESKINITSVAGTETSGIFARDSNGVWSKTLTLQWPAAKSQSRWAIGETIRSDLISVRFFVRIKITISSPSGTDTVELAEQELLIVSTNDSERQLAISKYTELATFSQSSLDGDGLGNGRSKSKSPRRTKREHRDTLPPPPPPANGEIADSGLRKSMAIDLAHSHNMSSASAPFTSGKPTKTKTSTRRPHTSAGPRDKPFSFSGARIEAYGRTRPQEDDVENLSCRRRLVNPRTTDDVDVTVTQRKYFSPRMSFVPTSNGAGTVLSTQSVTGSTITATSGVQGTPLRAVDQVQVRAWEEELERIEQQSRKSSDMVGFAYKRKRMTVQYPAAGEA